VAAPAAPQVAAPTKAAWFFVISAQPVRKKPNAVNATSFFLSIPFLPRRLPAKFCLKLVQGSDIVKKKLASLLRFGKKYFFFGGSQT